ncbi:MAG: potassium transporter TrkA [Chloroflexi bacterium]|nr:MAG: potassium transporter TrkA [Chloroflexota bacterium]
MLVIVVGGGKVGSYLAGLLQAEGHSVRVVEQQFDHIARLRAELPSAAVVEGSGSDPDVLERAGVRQAQVVAAMTGDDETNLVVTNLARVEFGVPRVIARVNNPRNAWLYTPEMGVDVAVNQADLIAHLILEEMSLGDMMTLLKLRRGEFALVEERVHPSAAAAHRLVAELDLPAECVLTAVLRQGRLLIPRGNTRLEPGDEVLALVYAPQAQRLAALLGPPAAA